MDTYDQQALAADFQRLGLTAGDTVFVHSALSTLGHVEGGADTVIAALLSVVGHSGTLAAPAFTYEEDPDLFDIANQPRAWAGSQSIFAPTRGRDAAPTAPTRFPPLAPTPKP